MLINWNKIMGMTQGDWVTLHSMRRTAASILTEKVSLHAAQYYLGHKGLGATLKYVYPREQDMAQLVETMSGYYEKQMWAAGWNEKEMGEREG